MWSGLGLVAGVAMSACLTRPQRGHDMAERRRQGKARAARGSEGRERVHEKGLGGCVCVASARRNALKGSSCRERNSTAAFMSKALWRGSDSTGGCPCAEVGHSERGGGSRGVAPVCWGKKGVACTRVRSPGAPGSQHGRDTHAGHRHPRPARRTRQRGSRQWRWRWVPAVERRDGVA